MSEVCKKLNIFFGHSVNCSDRVSVKIDHGLINRPRTSLVQMYKRQTVSILLALPATTDKYADGSVWIGSV